mgnify:CR=1 FL=1
MTKGLLNDIGTEELAHIEIVCAIIYQLTKNLSVEEIKASGFDKYYVDHTLGIWPQAAGGIPFNACVFQVKGDPITDLTEAIQKFVILFVSCASAKLSTSSVSVKHSSMFKRAFRKMFMPTIRPLIIKNTAKSIKIPPNPKRAWRAVLPNLIILISF